MKKQTNEFLFEYLPLFSDWFRYKLSRDNAWLHRKNILEYYSKKPDAEISEEIRTALDYIKRKGTLAFPYPFWEKYKLSDVKVFKDDECNLRYVIHEGHRLYFKEGMRASRIKRLYSSLLREQDPISPHCYHSPDFLINPDSVIFDIGAAEGIYALMMIDKVSKIYLLEADKKWIKALEKTFEPWKDKVVIINKYVSNQNSDTEITVDSITKDFEKSIPIVLKIDVEGAEKIVIEGAANTVVNPESDIKAIICTYHKQNDHHELSAIMNTYNFKISTTSNYMLYTDRTFAPPYFRRGLIHCQNNY